MNFRFSVRLARVKEKTLFGVRSRSQVRSGPGQEVGLSWDRAKPLTRIALSLIP
jgi:hypothetical protein